MPASPAFTWTTLVAPSSAAGSYPASSAIVAQLDSTDGVTSTSWEVESVDDTGTTHTLVPSGSKNSIVSFTTGVAGTAGILKCTVNGEVNPQTGNVDTSMTTTRKWYVPTAAGLQVGCVTETTQAHPTHGQASFLNPWARAIGIGTVTADTLLDATTGNESCITIEYEVDKATSGNDTFLTVTKTETNSPADSYWLQFIKGAATMLQVQESGAYAIGETGTMAFLQTARTSSGAGAAATFQAQKGHTNVGGALTIGGGEGGTPGTHAAGATNIELGTVVSSNSAYLNLLRGTGGTFGRMRRSTDGFEIEGVSERIRLISTGGLITLSAGASVVSSSLTSATGDEVALSVAYTTNKATSGDDTGIKITQTDTASPGTSRIVDALVGSQRVFSLLPTGAVSCGQQAAGAGTASGWATQLGQTSGTHLSGDFMMNLGPIAGGVSAKMQFERGAGTTFGRVWYSTSGFTVDAAAGVPMYVAAGTGLTLEAANGVLQLTSGGSGTIAQLANATTGTFTWGNFTQASGRHEEIHVPEVSTTDATVTTLASYTPPTDGAYTVVAHVEGFRDDESESWHYIIVYSGRRAAGSLNASGTPTALHTAEDDASAACTMDISGGAFRVRGTGVAAKNITWRTIFEVRCKKGT